MKITARHLPLPLGLLAAAGLAGYIWLNLPDRVKLDNAFVVGRVIRLAAPMEGMVEAINVTRFAVLGSGERAFLINDQATAEQVRSAELAVRSAFSEAGQSCMKLQRQAEQVEIGKLAIEIADNKTVDARKLSEKGFVSKRYVEQQEFNERTAGLTHKMDMLEQRRLAMETDSAVPGSKTMVEAIAQLRQALIERRRSLVKVDSSIFVQDIHVLPGQWVDAGAPLATVVPLDTLRVQANIIESQIGKVSLGQPVEVRIDGLGRNRVIRGHVEAVVPATAATFSQVQRNTADSTWMKVSQRIPVVIRIDDPIQAGTLHVGQSAEVVLLPASAGAPRTPAAPAHASDARGASVRDSIDLAIRTRLDRERAEVSARLRLPNSCLLFRLK